MPRARGKGGRRRGRAVKGTKPDRLSDLPDEVLCSILSFLDTKSAVGSAILSSRWRSLWKTVPVVNFDGESFNNEVQSFADHVDKFTELRSGSTPVEHISLLGCPGFVAASNVFTDLLYSISRCDKSLETLKLRAVRLYPVDFAMAGSGFKVLTTLTLSECWFDCNIWCNANDPFGRFPMLKNLKLISCSCCLVNEGLEIDRYLEVSGPQLLTLEIRAPFGFNEIEVSAPKLQSFTYVGVVRDSFPVTEVSLDLPSLKHANIVLLGYMGLRRENDKQKANQHYADMLLGVSSVENLSLQFDTLEALLNAYDLVKHRSPLFRRLKSLSMQFYVRPACIPGYVMRFFFDGSSRKKIL